MSDFFILKGHTPVQVDLMTWAFWLEKRENQVALDTLDDVMVSTIFIGMACQMFETRVFGGEWDGYTLRPKTWEEAMQRHAETVAKVRGMAEAQK